MYNKHRRQPPPAFFREPVTAREGRIMGPYCWSLALPLLLGAAQEDLPAGWKMVAPKDAGFSVTMPSAPMEKKQQVKTATGTLTVILQIAEGRNDSHFVVSYCDFAPGDLKKGDVDKRLDQARDGAVASAGGKKRSEEAIKLGSHPGREIVIEKDGEVVVKMRIYLVKNRLYQVMVLGNGPVFASKDAATFLDSFRLNE
jgi:hypothetical protein